MTTRDLIPMWLRYRVMEWRGRDIYSGYPNEHQCIFIHIPKTAGTSIVKALFGNDSRHVPCVEYERANRRKFKRYFKFAFARNPWARLHSAYEFLKKGGMNEMDAAWAASTLAPYASFEEFVVQGLRRPEIRKWIHFQSQVSFVEDESGRIAMDYIGRVENIAADFAVIQQRLGIGGSLVHLNRSTIGSYEQAYTAEMIDIVANVYERDVQAFGYTFHQRPDQRA